MLPRGVCRLRTARSGLYFTWVLRAGTDLLISIHLLIRFVSFALQIYKMKYSNNIETNNIIPNKINSFNIT